MTMPKSTAPRATIWLECIHYLILNLGPTAFEPPDTDSHGADLNGYDSPLEGWREMDSNLLLVPRHESPDFPRGKLVISHFSDCLWRLGASTATFLLP